MRTVLYKHAITCFAVVLVFALGHLTAKEFRPRTPPEPLPAAPPPIILEQYAHQLCYGGKHFPVEHLGNGETLWGCTCQ